MGVYRHVYPGHTSKEIIIVRKCKLLPGTLRSVLSKQLATTAKILCVIFFAWRREEMANAEGGPIKGNLWKQG